MKRLLLLTFALASFVACSSSSTGSAAGSTGTPDAGETPQEDAGVDAAPTGVTLTQVQNDVFAGSCAGATCHGASAKKADLDLSSVKASCAGLVGVASTESSPTGPECSQGGATKAKLMRVVAGDPSKSFLYLKVNGSTECVSIGGTQAGERMPLDRGALQAAKVALVKQWIEGGASCD